MGTLYTSTTTYKAETDQSVDQRRSANYKPNIWENTFLQSLPTIGCHDESEERQVQKLVEDVKKLLKEAIDDGDDELAQLELISSITKLGLSNFFDNEIRDGLGSIAPSFVAKNNDLYTSSLGFRLLRQYGYSVSQDIFMRFQGEKGNFTTSSSNINVKALIELFEASNFGLEEEHLLKEAKSFSMMNLQNLSEKMSDNDLSAQLNDTFDVPLHWKLEWFNARRQINAYEQHTALSNSPKLLQLAKLNFNRVQVVHQQDLKDVTLRWWGHLGVSNKLSFARDRMVESFLLATGMAPDHHHRSLRKWLAKTIQLILIVDDIYDIFGSLPELVKFTNAIERWNFNEVKDLPECMSICFQILDDTTKEIATEIQKKMDWGLVLKCLRDSWADFCKALLMEARWYTKSQTPSLEEYLSNGWISSSGPLLAVHIIFGVTQDRKEIFNFFEISREIIYLASLIVRLCNDDGTSAVELERGDSPSSILCYMKEANVSEEDARGYIRRIIANAWMNINNCLLTLSQEHLQFVKYVVNIARIGHFMYQHGDGFGVQDQETKQEIISNLIEPVEIHV